MCAHAHAQNQVRTKTKVPRNLLFRPYLGASASAEGVETKPLLCKGPGVRDVFLLVLLPLTMSRERSMALELPLWLCALCFHGDLSTQAAGAPLPG